MAKLTSPTSVVVPGVEGHSTITLNDGDEIPDWALDQLSPDLKGEGDAPDAEKSPASSGDTFEIFSEEDLRNMSNDQLEELLDQRQVDHPARARKDDLVALVLEYQKTRSTGGTTPGQEPV